MPEVRITDEMVSAFVEAHLKADGALFSERVRVGLSAALSGMEPVKVKPLEWVTDNFGPDEYIVYAKFFDLRYEIEPPYSAGFNFRIKRSSDIQPFAWRDTLEAAKAAAQADYEQRIRSALAAPPASDLREARNQAFREAANLIAEYQIVHTSSGDVLEPRGDGNKHGMAYATAVAALQTEGK